MNTITPKTREALLPYVSVCLDDALNVLSDSFVTNFRRTGGAGLDPSVQRARLVGWQCGFEPMVVAVFSYLPAVTLDEDEAIEIATDYLRERNWFADPSNTEPDFVV